MINEDWSTRSRIECHDDSGGVEWGPLNETWSCRSA